jgi:uncharacterized protein YjbI with pentapeptide repeats
MMSRTSAVAADRGETFDRGWDQPAMVDWRCSLVAVLAVGVVCASLVAVRRATPDTAQTPASIGVAPDSGFTGRFAAAVDLLGSDQIETRLGGIYALEGVMRASRPDQPMVVETLAAFVREHAGAASHGPTPDAARQPGDVQAALTVLGRRDTTWDRSGHRLNLVRITARGAQLPAADLRHADLDRSDLTGAQLAGATLVDAHLVQAHLLNAALDGADLSAADLSAADLTGAKLNRATLRDAVLAKATLVRTRFDSALLPGASLTEASLRGADFGSAKLTGANLRGADLTDAFLDYADVSGADLLDAKLHGANLGDANLTGADLTGADLTGVWLGGAKLTNARVTTEQLSCATLDGDTVLPAGVAPPTTPAVTCSS